MSMELDHYLSTRSLRNAEVCIVYNVPDDHFNHSTYKADLRAVLAFVFNQTLAAGNWNDWEEVNGRKYLFRGCGGPTRAQVHAFASAAWDEVGLE